uniref:Uncharacterized protein n=1 Tax=Magallana gigas TaxID=29159 RepID=A0A8W8MRT4_MAGGI
MTTSYSIYKKYDNIKQRAKEKIDGIRRPKTGGGPPTAPLTQAEEALYQAMDTRPNIVGLVGGIDSDEPTSSVQSLAGNETTCTGDASASSESSASMTFGLSLNRKMGRYLYIFVTSKRVHIPMYKPLTEIRLCDIISQVTSLWRIALNLVGGLVKCVHWLVYSIHHITSLNAKVMQDDTGDDVSHCLFRSRSKIF